MKIHHTAICVDDIHEAMIGTAQNLNLRLNIKMIPGLAVI